MSERNARRAEQRRERETARAGRAGRTGSRSDAAAPSAKGQPQEVASTSFEALIAEDGNLPPARDTSFEELNRGFDAPSTEEDSAEEGDAQAEAAMRAEADYGASGRLILPPMDENRPILTGSGYQPPSHKAYVVAFTVFGLAGLAFYLNSPNLREVIWPFDYSPLEFESGQLAPASDGSPLRGVSNVKSLDLFAQGPIFFIAWTILILYFGGVLLILVSLVRSAVSSYFAKRRMKKMEEKFPGPAGTS